LVLWLGGTGSDGVELALRTTARVSFFWFLLAYLATPLHVLAEGQASRWLVRRRRSLGVIFGVSMTMHVAFILSLFRIHSPERPPMVTDADFWIGIPGLVLVALMTATSFDALKSALGPVRWKRLHRTGLHLVWAIFFLCLVDSVGRKEAVSPLLEYHVFIAMLLMALALRVAAARKRASLRAA
jgi:methionine sulfoxide reductase heme-binding subunit